MKFPTRSLSAPLLCIITQLLQGVEAIPTAATPDIIRCDLVIPGPPVTASTLGTSVTGLQLSHNGNTAILASEGFNTRISFTNGGLGFFDGCHEWWLNVGSSSHSYKPLSLGFDDEETTTWVGSLGSTLKSSAPHTSTFLACYEGGQWVLYLETGKSLPPYEHCVKTQLSIGTGP